MANQTGVGQNVPGNQPDYLNGAPILTGSTFAMANHCGNGDGHVPVPTAIATLFQWAPEYVTVSDAWNLTPGQRIDGPITGGNGIHFDSGVGVQNLTASSEGAELLVGQAMADITFEYDNVGKHPRGKRLTSTNPVNDGGRHCHLGGRCYYRWTLPIWTVGVTFDIIQDGEWRHHRMVRKTTVPPHGTRGRRYIATSADGAHSVVVGDMDTSNGVPWQVADIVAG